MALRAELTAELFGMGLLHSPLPLLASVWPPNSDLYIQFILRISEQRADPQGQNR